MPRGSALTDDPLQMASTIDNSLEPQVSARAAELNAAHQDEICRRTDRLFVWLMGLQWVAGLLAALWISPRTWSGAMSQAHLHVWAAFALGGAICSLPVYLALRHPGRTITRMVIAAGQVLMSALLIHLTGGRIETHFHVFGSLALLACYRDWRVLAVATVVVTLDHAGRGIFWPQSVYGVQFASTWRFFEHAGWVLFEDIFLLITIRQSRDEMWRIAEQRARLEATNSVIETEVDRRTAELESARNELTETVAELQRKNQELDEFSYVASHDLQEPVRKLISFSKLLKDDIGDDLNESARTDLGFIVDSAERMRQLIQDLLVLSRAGRSAMQQQPCSLDECVDDALSALSERITETDARIVRDPLPIVIGDRSMLTQLYQNLIGNALKFVTDHPPEVYLTAQREGDLWTLGVKDNGIGIKQDYVERVFGAFQRLHRRSEYEGTGIGLAICKKTVERHGGRLWVESQPGLGSHFRYTIEALEEENIVCCATTAPADEQSFCS